MTVYKDKERNTWYFVTRKKQINGETKQIKRREFKTRAAAKEAEAKLLITQNDTNSIVTFKQVTDHFMMSIKPQIKEATYDKYDDCVRLHLLPYFGTYPIAKITAKNIKDWKLQHQAKDFTTKTNNNHFKILGAIFKHAMKFFDLVRNPVAIAGSFKSNSSDSKEMLFWIFEEYNKFIEIVDNQKYHLLFNILYYTGMRRGELLALQWSDFTDNVISITKAVSRPKSGAVIITSKTSSSIREIALPKILINELNTYKNGLKHTLVSFNDEFYNLGSLKFLAPTTLNNKLQIYTTNKKFKKLNIPKIRMHDLRHLHASYLINMFNANPKEIAERLGHKDVAETLNTYSHMYPNGKFELAKK